MAASKAYAPTPCRAMFAVRTGEGLVEQYLQNSIVVMANGSGAATDETTQRN